jgi:hypothetical protein
MNEASQVDTSSQEKAEASEIASSPYVLTIIIQEPSSKIDTLLLDKVDDLVNETTIDNDNLFIVLHTNGGDPYAAMGIIKILRSRFKNIYSIVPYYAFSAGTLMALGTDAILMSVRSMLGPLDLPIEHPKDGSHISALDVQNTFADLASYTNDFFVERYTQLRNLQDGRLGKKDAAELACKSVNELVEPIVRQIDPLHLNNSIRILRIGYRYATDLLYEGMFEHDYQQAKDTARKLVLNYPEHGFGIFRDEARSSLRLKVGDLEELTLWNQIERAIKSYITLNKDVVLLKKISFFISPTNEPE